jgi:hypothetical protein
LTGFIVDLFWFAVEKWIILLRPCIYAALLAFCVALSVDIGNVKKELKVLWVAGNYFFAVLFIFVFIVVGKDNTMY